MMRGCIEFLCSQDPRAIRPGTTVFKVVPMLNPDGAGGSTRSLAGEDLNRDMRRRRRRCNRRSTPLQPENDARDARPVLCDITAISRKMCFLRRGTQMAPPPPRELTEALQRAASGEGEPPHGEAGRAAER